MAYKYYKGRFYPKNPQKYNGDPRGIIYRSGLEYKFFVKFDENPSILEWASEEFYIPYFDETTERMRRYFVDVYIKIRTKNNEVKKYIVEIKPDSQTKKPRKNKKNYLQESLTYIKNQCKWEAATEFAKKNGMEFIILTEKNL